ncbi:MAG: DNA translocase FtsK [Synergistaceae bacterium]
MIFNKERKSVNRKNTQFSYTKYINILMLTTFSIVSYIIASLFTSSTGKIGVIISSFLTNNFGGATIILLLYILYLLILKLFNINVTKIIRQTIGIFLLYIDLTALLGLYKLTNISLQQETYSIFSPGKLGILFSNKLIFFFGEVGTLFIGLIAIYLLIIIFKINYNFKFPFNLKINHKNKNSSNIKEENNSSISYIETEDDDKNINTLEEIQDPAFITSDNFLEEISSGEFPPPIAIFGPEESHEGEFNEKLAMPIGEKIIQTLNEFNIEATLAEALIGPTVIQFRIQLAPGIKVSRVAALSNDIALAMAVPSLRIEAPIPGKPYIGIEIPNPKRRGIPFRTILESKAYQDTELDLPLPFGVGVNGDSVIVGLEELPHLLVAGTTGSGKSVFVNSCIVGLCSTRTPQELRMILVDPKKVEMSVYDQLPHLLTPPVTDAKKAVHVLAWAIREMEKRYSIFAGTRVRNLEGYNEKVLPMDRLPNIVIVVDELADLMMTAPKEVEEYICRLAQMARATGIHLILATQRPSVNVITGLIKANIPARVAFTLPSNADSRTIIDSAGAEKLLGKGDMLFLSTKHPKPIRIQSPWVSESVLVNWLTYLKNTFGEAEYIEIKAPTNSDISGDTALYDDDLLEDAISLIMSTGIASASGLQRRLRIGFSRASRLIDMLEQLGVVGCSDGARPREILVDEESALSMLEEAKEKSNY